MSRSLRALFPLVLAALAAPGCKETTVNYEEGGDDADYVDAHRSPEKELNAADAQYLQKNATFFFRIWSEGFTRKFDDLPVKGEVPADKRPYSGGYYPEQGGGTDVVMVGNKSPLEKYDQAFNNGQNLASAWEREKHTTGPVWAGHCNGFAAAAQRHPKEAAKSVTRGGVTFDAKDIKALMAEIHMNADYEFLGGNRCDVPGDPSDGRIRPTGPNAPDPTVMGPCEDINPGTLHAALGNWLGRMRHTLVMDMFAGDEVWNYPLYKYEVLSKEVVPESQARQYVSNTGGEYIWNPAAVKFVYVNTKLTYAEAVKNEILGQLYPKEMDLHYVLELNANGDILGGEWAGEASRKYHPDFLWVALEPLQPNATRYMGNPHLSNDEVIKMWAESAGYDPASPPLDIKRPSGPEDWGKWSSFEVTLDGNQRGAVFAGKKANMRVKRKTGLTGPGISVDIALNGAALQAINPAEEDELKVAFDPGLGLNRLQFVWKKDGTQVEDQYLRFHVVP